jgi:hypothetical protein
MVLDPAEVIAVTFFIASMLLVPYCYHLRETIGGLQAKLDKELSKPGNPINSLELTEFLTDMKRHNYSFVRVDPDSMFYRSPREQ